MSTYILQAPDFWHAFNTTAVQAQAQAHETSKSNLLHGGGPPPIDSDKGREQAGGEELLQAQDGTVVQVE